MKQQQTPAPIKPVELALEDLEHVSGGLPKGGWLVEPDPAVAATASALVDPTPLPKGGW